jgi:hypothetical protein
MQVTELRKHVMPLDGTFDFWVLLFSMSLSLFAAGMGIRTLIQRDALIAWDDGEDSLRWIGVVFAIADATPGLLFLGYVHTRHLQCLPRMIEPCIAAMYLTVPSFVPTMLPMVPVVHVIS